MKHPYLENGRQIYVCDITKDLAERATKIPEDRVWLGRSLRLNEARRILENPALTCAYQIMEYIAAYKRMGPQPDLTEYELGSDMYRLSGRRTVEEILRQGILPCCSDIATVFRGLMISLTEPVPTSFLEGFDRDFVYFDPEENFSTHGFGRLHTPDGEIIVDPSNRMHFKSETAVYRGIEGYHYIFIPELEGLDLWAMGLGGRAKNLYDDYKAKRSQFLEELKRKEQKIRGMKI